MKRIFFSLVFCLLAVISNAQWQASNTGLTGGYINNLTIDPSTHYIYAGTNMGGIYMSKDNGANWNSVSTGLPPGYISAITISGNTIYAGTTSGIYLSENNGSSWTGLINFSVSGPNSIVKYGNKIIAGTPGYGVSLSTDNCETWTPLNNGLSYVARNILTIMINDGIIFLGTGDGVYISTNDGELWTKSNTGISNVVSSFAILGSNIFAGSYSGVYVSSNNGTSWAKMSNGLTENALYINYLFTDGTSVYAATQAGIYVSLDNGVSWNPRNNGLMGSDLTFKSIAKDGNNLFIGNSLGGGVFLSTNAGSSWTAINTGLFNTTVTEIEHAGDNLFINGYGIALSTDNGNTWTSINNGIPGGALFASHVAVRGTKIFCGTLKNGIYVTENNGLTWSAVNNGLSGNSLTINDLVVSGNNIFAGTNDGVFLSVNDGASWSAVHPSHYSWALASYGNTVYTYTEDGTYRSTNYGGTWEKTSNGLPDTKVNQIVLCGTKLFAATNDGVYMSEDNGDTWVRRFIETPSNIPVNSITVSGDMLFASTVDFDGGVYVSIDNGNTWKTCNEGLATLDIFNISVSGNSILAGTRAFGVFRRLISDFRILQLSTYLLNITDPELRTATFNVISNIDWTVSCSDPWISMSRASGSGISSITITAEKNTTEEERTAEITISGTGLEDQILYIYQANDITTSVNNDIADPEIVIYPNPVSNILNLKGIPENTLASIYNSQGKIVLLRQLKGSQIDISSLANGLYLIKLNYNQEVTIKRFVKK